MQWPPLAGTCPAASPQSQLSLTILGARRRGWRLSSPGERAELVSLRAGQRVPADAAARRAQHPGPAATSGVMSGTVTSRWMRFLTVFGSGTGTKSMVRTGMPGTPSTVNQPSLSVTLTP